VLPSLLAEFAGKVNLIYIDPPFDTGADFSFTANVPDHPDTSEDDSFTFTKEPSIIEHKAYRDTWGRGMDPMDSMGKYEVTNAQWKAVMGDRGNFNEVPTLDLNHRESRQDKRAILENLQVR
jgi:hypothetical protein